jgi:hypothetical protein
MKRKGSCKIRLIQDKDMKSELFFLQKPCVEYRPKFNAMTGFSEIADA